MKQYLYKNRRLAIIYLILVILAILIPVGQVAAFQLFIWIIEKQKHELFAIAVGGLLVFIFMSCILNWLYEKAKRKYYEKTMSDIHQDLLQGILSKSFIEQTAFDSGYYMSLFQNDVKMVEEKYIKIRFVLVGSIVQLVVCILYAAYFNLTIGIIILMISLVSLKFPTLLARNLDTYNKQDMEQQSRYTSFLKNILGGFEVIYNFLARKDVMKEYQKVNEESQSIHYKTQYKNNVVMYLTTMLDIGYALAILGISGYSVLQGRMDIAVMLAMYDLSDRVFYPLIEIINDMNYMKSTKEIRCHLASLIQSKPKDNMGITLNSTFESMQMQDLTFHYPGHDENIVCGMNYTFLPKRKYAVVGDSGSGKSTFIKILLGYYQDYQGTCSLNNVAIHDVAYASIHELISLIPQLVFLFETTLRNNITMFKNYSDQQVQVAIKKAQLQPLIDTLPNGLDTMLLENGSNFSGGEKQRIALARAYLIQAPLMILDEAFSSLDNRAAYTIENEVLQNKELACIHITHRLQEELLKKYDEILVVKKGKIVEHGTFESLKNKNGAFMQLFAMYATKGNE